MAAQGKRGGRSVAQNRKAFHNYEIEDRVEAGLMLTGTEVKSLREGRASIGDAHAGPMYDGLWLFNAYIPEYHGGNRFNHETRRPRKLLLRKREIDALLGAAQRKGYTLVPLSLYFNGRGWAKIEIGLGRGKKMHDKRQSEKDRDWKREKERIMKSSGRD